MTIANRPGAPEGPATVEQPRLDFFRRPGAMTTAGRYAARLDALPRDVAALPRIAQGLAIHEFMVSAYGVTVPEERKEESHIRALDRMLDRILAEDVRPLTEAREPRERLVGACNHFAALLVGMLRAKGIPARARWGFASYFNPPFFEDHVLGEYWNAGQMRWVRVDAQLDEVFRRASKITFDPLDVPHDRFLIAGDAWGLCRAGQADPEKFGIFKGDLRGLWFIAGSLIKDIAALNKMEMLPWDIWGAMPEPGAELPRDQVRFFDRLAALTRAPDQFFEEIRRLYEADDRLRVPATVYNAVRKQAEPV